MGLATLAECHRAGRAAFRLYEDLQPLLYQAGAESQIHFPTPLPSSAPAAPKRATATSASASNLHPFLRSRCSPGVELPPRCNCGAPSQAFAARHGFSSVPSEAVKGDAGWQLEYEGTVSQTVRTLKLVSITTALLSLVGSPAYLYVTYGVDQFAAVKAFAAAGFTCFGLGTTGLLHWFLGPYVHQLWYNPKSNMVKVKTLTIFSQPRFMEFALDEIQAPDSIAPLQTFAVKGRVLFVDEAGFKDKELLQKLTPASEYSFGDEGKDEEDDDVDSKGTEASTPGKEAPSQERSKPDQ